MISKYFVILLSFVVQSFLISNAYVMFNKHSVILTNSKIHDLNDCKFYDIVFSSHTIVLVIRFHADFFGSVIIGNYFKLVPLIVLQGGQVHR